MTEAERNAANFFKEHCEIRNSLISPGEKNSAQIYLVRNPIFLILKRRFRAVISIKAVTRLNLSSQFSYQCVHQAKEEEKDEEEKKMTRTRGKEKGRRCTRKKVK